MIPTIKTFVKGSHQKNNPYIITLIKRIPFERFDYVQENALN